MALTNIIVSNPMLTIGLTATTVLITGYLTAYIPQKLEERKTFKSYQSRNPFVKYAVDHSLHLLPAQEKLMKITLNHPLGFYLGAPEICQLLQNLIRAINAKKVIEVGVFTGYTTLGLALALPKDGKVVGCEIDSEFINIGKPFWKEAGVEDKIHIKIQPAFDTLDELLANGEAETFDLAFIDADKENYDIYYEKCLQLIRKRGIIAIDNVLWAGTVLKTNPKTPGAVQIKQLNVKLKNDARIDISMLIIGDGLTLAFKV